DTSGNLDWVQRIGAAPLPQASSTVVLGQSIAVNADGSGVFVAGYTNSVVSGLTGSGGEDVVVARYAPDGQLEWVKQFGAVGRATRPDGLNDRGNGIALDPSGDVVVAGIAQGVLGSPGSNPGNRTIRDWFIAFLRAADGVFK
ncbi:MAG TPA: hypothetical protein VML54_04520, partial [Candidatus Limnocylindrales bacterium]|nr:hypothetical protein [Candidatus Limnocylindrales bacterium]